MSNAAATTFVPTGVPGIKLTNAAEFAAYPFVMWWRRHFFSANSGATSARSFFISSINSTVRFVLHTVRHLLGTRL